mmetsp:Transcript_17536/g.49096  ORF Transcript_17536/g.49096 Transcript_17536/m.49096 type:complete len:146 (-) Transcript_17536:1020-1457(-)
MRLMRADCRRPCNLMPPKIAAIVGAHAAHALVTHITSEQVALACCTCCSTQPHFDTPQTDERHDTVPAALHIHNRIAPFAPPFKSFRLCNNLKFFGLFDFSSRLEGCQGLALYYRSCVDRHVAPHLCVLERRAFVYLGALAHDAV